jgi:hypothetical protein
MSESSEEAAAETRLGGGGRANTRRTSRTSSSSSSSSSTTSNSPEKAIENDDGLLGVIGGRCSYDLDYVDYEDELGESQAAVSQDPSTDHKSNPDTTTQSMSKQEEKKPAAVKKRLSKCPSENNLRRALENDEEESTESSRRKNLSDRFQRHNRDRNVYNFHNTQLVIQDNNQALAKDEQQVRNENDRVNVKDGEKKTDVEQQNKSDESLVIINVNETQIIDEATGKNNNPVNPSTHLTYSKNQSTTSKTSHKAMKRFQSENNLYIKNMSVVYNNQTKDEKGGSPENHVNDNDKTKSCGLEIAKYNFSTDEDPNKV